MRVEILTVQYEAAARPHGCSPDELRQRHARHPERPQRLADGHIHPRLVKPGVTRPARTLRPAGSP